MTTACVFAGNTNVCPICIHCPFPERKKMDGDHACLTCFPRCEPCPRFLDHQDGYTKEIQARFKNLPIPPPPSREAVIGLMNGTVIIRGALTNEEYYKLVYGDEQ